MPQQNANQPPERAAFEYAAWLQPGGTARCEPMRLCPKEGIPQIVVEECALGMRRLFGADVWSDSAARALTLCIDGALPAEGYRLLPDGDGFFVAGGDAQGALYGVFELLLRLGAGEALADVRAQSAPRVARRIINHWDNMSGGIERGYAGKSIFFRDGALHYDPVRVRDYARLLASVGVNVIAINNVNVTPESAALIHGDGLARVAALADIFRPYGIRMALSVHFDSPALLGNLGSTDPLDPKVQAWWAAQTREVYRSIPDFSGYLVKADSEFRGGPGALGRSQADGANLLARALLPHGGVVYWRCFIYNCRQDWRDQQTDRPKAAYDLFRALDGQFAPNVILQVKNGPSDFQVREPNSPLLCAMRHTRQALELQITQEYTGHQIDLYNLAVQWEEILSAPAGDARPLRDSVGARIEAVAGVANVGDDPNWTGHTLAQANLFAFGRLSWDPARTAHEITAQWVALMFGRAPALCALTDMMLRSRSVYEKYNAPLGLGWMVNPGNHYGPSPEGYEYMKWGTYHRANREAVGVDRTRTGTGYTAQYPPELAAIYDDPARCPEELLLFFHRLGYSFRLRGGKTLLQHIYDTHFEGVEDVMGFIACWESLKEHLPGSVYDEGRERLGRQLENAREWRDVINTYFFRLTGVPDEAGRTIFP